MKRYGVWIGAACGTILVMGTATTAAREQPQAYLDAPAESVAAWRQLKFGLFIHWGPVSLKGTEIGWSRGGERRGRGGTGSIPIDVYDNLYKQFNPVKFDADEWVQVAKDAGMRYLVFTSKHHDGFSMFDSKLTEYKITNSPFRRDVVGDLARACHKADLKLGYYYSPVDWYHPDYRTDRHVEYVKFMHGQLREICSRYGKIDIIWFDGLGGTAQDWHSDRLFHMIRNLQPRVIINNRAGLPADHDTPEQRIGKFQNDRPWETCMTICRQWAWKPGDEMKSFKQCIQTLVRVVGGDGNLLFNVGPMPDGRIEPRQVERLREMGAWLEKYGESIYQTRGGPFKTTGMLASTYRGNTVYVHVLERPDEVITLPAIPAKIARCTVLTGGQVHVQQTDDSVQINGASVRHDGVDTILKLELDKPASEIPAVALPSLSIAQDKKTKASNVYRNNAHYGPDKAFDDDPATRWATDSGTKEAWLEVDLGEPRTFDQAVLSEAYDRVRKFELQIKEADQWSKIVSGTRIGEERRLRFTPVTARFVRLHVLEATDGPTFREFQLLAPDKKE